MSAKPGFDSIDIGNGRGCPVLLQNVSIHVTSNLWSRITSGSIISGKEKGKPEICILKPLHAMIEGASLFAILGGSGCGKTTLLNVLAGRYDQSSLLVNGSIVFGIKPCIVGYVTQNDYLLPNLTVKETLLFTARLKVPISANAPTDYLEKLVYEVIMDLGLKECMDSHIGDNDMTGSRRGISGGEKRRVSVALQIISNPQGIIIIYSFFYYFHHDSTLYYIV
jgi:ABC-type multidrug transport system ATPase subunit